VVNRGLPLSPTLNAEARGILSRRDRAMPHTPHVRIGRTRRIVGQEIIELDVMICPAENWDDLLLTRPALRGWSTVRLGPDVVALQPLPLGQIVRGLGDIKIGDVRSTDRSRRN
jgi:hypothetical protein